jgi:hypothetical protein
VARRWASVKVFMLGRFMLRHEHRAGRHALPAGGPIFVVI